MIYDIPYFAGEGKEARVRIREHRHVGALAKKAARSVKESIHQSLSYEFEGDGPPSSRRH